ncbi:MAG TPA: UDP-3-O-(3-hydroxymyristoyl)glucosamine N-acyltransferase, partial [Acidobacteriaceae bacterium]|nr:UDP-3-O-(3-hydroxymyristoyl)glucosamine N-acyltransferase [Acidobacteriaceae bacterium]
MTLSLQQLATILGASVTASGDATIARVGGIQHADAQSIVFVENAAALAEALASNAGAILLTPELAATIPNASKPLLSVAQPRLAFAKAAPLLRSARRVKDIHSTAVLGHQIQLGKQVFIGVYAVLGDHVRIGNNTRIDAGAIIGDGVQIGTDCHIYPRVVIYPGTTLADRVVVHAGCVLGADGFGYVRDTGTGAYTQFPQQGTLVIEEDVEIGANTTIDRGALEETRIARGSKLDNLVHIGHNVHIGHDVVIAAQTGISGSSAVGDGAIIGGQVGIGEHADVGPH